MILPIALGLALAQTLLAAAPPALPATPDEARDLLRRAQAVARLRDPANGPFTLALECTVTGLGDATPCEVRLDWYSTRAWREEIRLGPFRAERGMVDGLAWSAGGDRAALVLETLVDWLTDIPYRVQLAPGQRITAVRSLRRSGEPVVGLELREGDDISQVLYLSPAGFLLGDQQQWLVAEYAGWAPFGAGAFPRHLRLRFDSGIALEAEVTRLECQAPGAPPTDWIPPDASGWPACANPVEARRLPGPAPEYPEAARLDRARGTVGLAVFCSAAGEVEDVIVVRSSGDARLDAAAEASAWRQAFAPASCDGVPFPSAATFTVNFVLK